MLIRLGRLIAAGAPLLATAACGISAEHSAHAIPKPLLATRTPTTAVESKGPVDEELFLIKDGRLIAVTRQIRTTPSIASVSADLLAGPTGPERTAGYTSALLGTDLISAVSRQDSEAVIELTADSTDQVRNDQVLGFAQIVCTLTGLPGVTSVSFHHEGHVVAVPRADGSLSDSPLTAADYLGLVVANQ